MAYRDELAAAHARIAALEQELHGVKAAPPQVVIDPAAAARATELEAELDRLRTAPKPPVHAGPSAITGEELDWLLAALASGARAAKANRRAEAWIALVFGTLICTMAFATPKAKPALIGLLLLLAGAYMIAGLIRFLRLWAQADWQPVLDAIRNAPERVTSFRHVETRKRYHYVVSTFGHDLTFVHYQSDRVLALLARRCPKAQPHPPR
jgi:hypothetical protein